MQEAYKIGNAQSIGSCQIQSSYFASCCNGRGCLSVLADGTADHINGRRCAILAVEASMRQYWHMPENMEVPAFFDSVAAKVLRDMREIIFLGRTPYLSLSLLWVRERELHYYSVGSNQIFLYNGMDYQLMKRGFDTVAFEKGMTAGLVSCGGWEALNEKEMVSYLMKKEHPYDKAQHMIAGVREKNKKAAKTAAVVLVEGCL